MCLELIGTLPVLVIKNSQPISHSGQIKVLVSVRLKLEGNRIDSKGKRLALTVRSYIEKGPKTTELIGAR